MDLDYDSNTIVRSRGTSAVIELDISYLENPKLSRASMLRPSMNRHSASQGFARPSMVGTSQASRVSGEQRDEMEELGETLEHLTAEYGKAFCVAVDEDGCPDKPLNIQVHRHPYLKALDRTYREAIRPASYRYVTLNFRVMRRNAAMYVGYLVNQKGIRCTDLYKSEYLPIWTHCIRVKMRASVKIGVIFHGLKSRLGLTSAVGLHFCVDGFLGIEAFGDAFGNIGSGICPWMELSSNGSAKSLRLMDGDNIYVSVASESMRHLAQMRKLRANRRHSVSSSSVTLNQMLGKAAPGRDPARNPARDNFEKMPLELDF